MERARFGNGTLGYVFFLNVLAKTRLHQNTAMFWCINFKKMLVNTNKKPGYTLHVLSNPKQEDFSDYFYITSDQLDFLCLR